MKRRKFPRKRVWANPDFTGIPKDHVVKIKGVHDRFYINNKQYYRGFIYKMTRVASLCLKMELNNTYCGKLFYVKKVKI